jgi:L-fucose mutarotase
MGHGDELVVVDRNYPAYSAGPEVVELAGIDVTTAIGAILGVLPLDTFVEHPLLHMQPVDGEPQLPVHREVAELARRAEGREVAVEPLERFAFYERARSARAVVATSEDRPYGCFVLVKGVIAG